MKRNIVFALLAISISTITLQSCSKDQTSEAIVQEDVNDLNSSLYFTLGKKDYNTNANILATSNISTKQSQIVSHGEYVTEIFENNDFKPNLKANGNSQSTEIPFSKLVTMKFIVVDENNKYVTESKSVDYDPSNPNVTPKYTFDKPLKNGYKVLAFTYNDAGKEGLYFDEILGDPSRPDDIPKPTIEPNREFYYAKSTVTTSNDGKFVIDLKFIPIVAKVNITLDLSAFYPEEILTTGYGLNNTDNDVKITGLFHRTSDSTDLEYFNKLNFDLLNGTADETTLVKSGALLSDGYSFKQYYNSTTHEQNLRDTEVTNNGNQRLYTIKFSLYKYVGLDGKLVNPKGYLTMMVNPKIKFREKVFRNGQYENLVNKVSYTGEHRITSIPVHIPQGLSGLQNGKVKSYTIKLYNGLLSTAADNNRAVVSHGDLTQDFDKSYLSRFDYQTNYREFNTGISSSNLRTIDKYFEFDHWRHNSLNAGNPTNNENGDPCTKLLPLNAWKTPTENEFKKFILAPIESLNTTSGQSAIGLKSNNINNNDRLTSFALAYAPYAKWSGDKVEASNTTTNYSGAHYLLSDNNKVININKVYSGTTASTTHSVTAADENGAYRIRCIRPI